MSVTEKLLRVFRVDQQLNGLQSRLRVAEKFLEEQTKQLAAIDAKRDALQSQFKQIQAIVADHEGEMARLDARVEKLREQMTSAQTNKEYKAFLTEMNTFKADKSAAETAALEQMTKLDEFKKQVGELDAQRLEREKVQKVASQERAKHADEIKDRLTQLKAERESVAKEVPAEAMKTYVDLVRRLGDDAMAPVEELDRRRHEYSCGACQMAVPVETLNSLIRGSAAGTNPVRCVSCGCLLYIEKEVAERLHPSSGGGKRGKKESVPQDL